MSEKEFVLLTMPEAAAATMTRNQAAVPAAAVHPSPTTSVQDHPHRVAVAVRKVVVAKRRAGKTRSGERLKRGGMPKKRRGETLQRLNPSFRYRESARSLAELFSVFKLLL